MALYPKRAVSPPSREVNRNHGRAWALVGPNCDCW